MLSIRILCALLYLKISKLNDERRNLFTFVRHSKQVFKYWVLVSALAKAERRFSASQFEHFPGSESAIVKVFSMLVKKQQWIGLDCLGIWAARSS